MSLNDKVCLITGAGRGLGKALTLKLAALGARVVVNDVNPDAAETTLNEITTAGGRAIFIQADVANKMAVQTMHYEILDKWGRVDILINNAAVEPLGAVLTMDEWAWDRTFNVNLKGVFLCTQTVARSMKEQGGGVIINIGGSETGHDNHAAFVASKEGLAGFTRECAKEMASHNIQVVHYAHAGTALDILVDQIISICSANTKTNSG